MGGTDEATVIGFGDKIPAVNATLVNSLMIRALDFNDIYWKEDPSHPSDIIPVSYTHLRAHETVLDLVCRLLLEKKKILLNKYSI